MLEEKLFAVLMAATPNEDLVNVRAGSQTGYCALPTEHDGSAD